jgi:hypothetical protein
MNLQKSWVLRRGVESAGLSHLVRCRIVFDNPGTDIPTRVSDAPATDTDAYAATWLRI